MKIRHFLSGPPGRHAQREQCIVTAEPFSMGGEADWVVPLAGELPEEQMLSERFTKTAEAISEP
jgi:hypothetical protein